MGKLKTILILILIGILLAVSIYISSYLIQEYKNFEITNIELIEFLESEQLIKIKITKDESLYHKDFVCIAKDNNTKEVISVKGTNNSCTLKLPINKDYSLLLKDENLETKEYNILDYIDNKLNFSFKEDTIYMLVGDQKDILYTTSSITTKKEEYVFLTKNEDVINIVNNKIVALKPGKAEVYTPTSNDILEVIVTDLIKKPEIKGTNKSLVPCGIYTADDNILLDKLLELRIESAGYKTRAGVVAAARFLTLEFPYKIPYFYENGRVHKSGVNYVDGEGRYYHKGLYLNKYKFKDIVAKFSGPQIWGCPLNNWEDAPEYNYVYGEAKPNGLDCSGFVAWVLFNGGYNPGDIGAGESSYPYQMTDLGEYTKLTHEVIASNKIKVGDLFNYWGHIAIIIGMDENNFYVAESLPNFGGVIAKSYKKNTVNNTFIHVVLMDNYYQNDGNYTEMWN